VDPDEGDVALAAGQEMVLWRTGRRPGISHRAPPLPWLRVVIGRLDFAGDRIPCDERVRLPAVRRRPATMVATAEKKLLTAADVWNMGEDACVELIRGELREVAAAGERHGEVGGQLATYFGVYGQFGRRGRVYTSETGFVLEKSPTTLLVPDLAYIKVEH